ncbi:hypothetical protein FPG87_12500 [Flavobacterium psychrophilum]|uniref:Uncharacterized protein n=1 Tax=Flavobacterium psychrophilum TaxID=96345 RepID=A0A7U2RBG2_FLAPS|nr:hypothetical protein [Flavobacterium psychrophilum]MBF2091279.1 hypothetical protein [Flavobacterium psychrophilum]OAE92158.1 hypothetical protein SU65_10410 [Flavobacterium psychrophilum]OJH10062.1 hypothetical protein FPG87_12500 [Flavobacterium psychrophilum]QRE05314.1 hypothetical protein H0H26_06930 [Flavobacterium psychrophilum]
MSSEIIKTAEIPHDELVYIYEQRCVELKREYDDNLWLKSENKRLQFELDAIKRNVKKAIE